MPDSIHLQQTPSPMGQFSKLPFYECFKDETDYLHFHFHITLKGLSEITKCKITIFVKKKSLITVIYFILYIKLRGHFQKGLTNVACALYNKHIIYLSPSSTTKVRKKTALPPKKQLWTGSHIDHVISWSGAYQQCTSRQKPCLFSYCSVDLSTFNLRPTNCFPIHKCLAECL